MGVKIILFAKFTWADRATEWFRQDLIRLAIKDPYGDFLDTALGTLNILETVRTNKTPLVYTSTCKIYSSELNIVPTKVTETRYIWNFKSPLYKKLRLSIKEAVSKFGVNEYFPVDSVGKFAHAPYGVSHATGDLYCQEYFLMYQVPVVINRMSTIYGFYQQGSENQGFIDWMVKSKIKNESLNLETNGKSVRDILWVDDLTDLFLEELVQIAKVKGNVFNIGGGNKNTITIRETFKYLDSKYGGRTKLKFGPGRPADQKIYITDIRKVKKTLNWSPKTSAYNGIDRLLNWYKMPKP